MLYTLTGKIILKRDNFFVLEIGGFGVKVFAPAHALRSLIQSDKIVKIFTYFKVKEDAFEIYGFLSEEELSFFELLNSVNGVGPKSALNIMNVDTLERLTAAISEGKAELLTKASGVGKKTAERVVLELRGKLSPAGAKELVGIMESDSDIVDALVNLGYTRHQAKSALSKIGEQEKSVEGRVKAALKLLKNS